MTGSRRPRIWALYANRRGDNNQLLALLEQLGLPFETRTLRFNLVRLIGTGLIGSSLVSIRHSLRKFIAPPWPDLVIAIGRNAVPLARHVRKQTGGRAKLVLLGHPRTDPSDFDLIITSPQYPLPDHRNVLVFPLVISRITPGITATDEEREWLAALPRPHVLMAIGGSTWHYQLVPERMADAASKLADRAATKGGTLIAIGSPRTASKVLDAIAQRLEGTRHVLTPIHWPRFPILMNDADEIFVTADSLSMMSEAVLTGKPAGLVPVVDKTTGREWVAKERKSGRRFRNIRDLSQIWTRLKKDGLIGTLDHPTAGKVDDPVIAAAEAVRALLNDFEG